MNRLVDNLSDILIIFLKCKLKLVKYTYVKKMVVDRYRSNILVNIKKQNILKTSLINSLKIAYRLSIKEVFRDTGIPLKYFPITCPWTIENVLSLKYFPVVQGRVINLAD